MSAPKSRGNPEHEKSKIEHDDKHKDHPISIDKIIQPGSLCYLFKSIIVIAWIGRGNKSKYDTEEGKKTLKLKWLE